MINRCDIDNIIADIKKSDPTSKVWSVEIDEKKDFILLKDRVCPRSATNVKICFSNEQIRIKDITDANEES